MTRYEWEYARPDENRGFDVDGEVVFVDPGADPSARGCHVLIERPESDKKLPATFDVSDDGGPYCSGENADGSRCSRTVYSAGDYCFQHEP